MRGLNSVLRVVIFTACALWFMRTSAVHAQFGGDICVKQFATENGTPSFDCCPKQPQAQAIIIDCEDCTQGLYTADQEYANCGGGTCNGGDCSTSTPYFVAAMDANCCLPSGTPCNQGTCCQGLICLSNNTCGRCVGTGQTCGNDYDCCSQNCTGGKCSKCPPGCIQNGNECSCCPIVLDTTGHGFRLTDIAHGVYFRWEPDGPKYAMSWTDPAGGNGWLTLPDKNGGVHDATNLFSSATPQPKTADPNGYIALAVYDLPSEGGDSNGWIDRGDKIYSKLRVWIDANQDGEAQPDELHTLDQLGIKRIGLRYHLAEKVDQYGNVSGTCLKCSINPIPRPTTYGSS